jgi:hypothetical protein
VNEEALANWGAVAPKQKIPHMLNYGYIFMKAYQQGTT